MALIDKKISFTLADNEKVVYSPNKNKVEFFIFFLLSLFAFMFFISFIIALTLKSVFDIGELFFILMIVLGCNSLYEYVRDYIFTKTVLTDKRIIIVRFNKIISFNYNEVTKIYYQKGILSPSYFAILLNSNKIYKVNFIPSKQFKQKIEEINQEIQYKNNIFMPSELLNKLYLTFSKNSQIIFKNIPEQKDKEESIDCLIIQPKRIYMLKFIFSLLFFTVLFYFCYKIAPPYDYTRFFGLTLSCLFGVITIGALRQFILLKPSLIVKTEGLYYQGIFIPWSNVNNFSLNTVNKSSQMILINLNNYDEVINQFNPIKRKIVMLNKLSVGDVLPVSLLGTNLKLQDTLEKLKYCLEIANNNS